MKPRFLGRMLLYALFFYVLFQCLNGLIFLLSHLPVGVTFDWFILRLGNLTGLLTLPRHLLRHLWPGESTPALLNFSLTFGNFLLWGAAFAAFKSLRSRERE